MTVQSQAIHLPTPVDHHHAGPVLVAPIHTYPLPICCGDKAIPYIPEVLMR